MVNAIIAAILSFLIPGLGQGVAGNLKKGILFFIITLIIGTIGTFVFKHWLVYMIDILYALFAAYDAYQMANKG